MEATVRQFGVIQPIVVRPIDGGKYELIAGRSRLLTQKKEGKKEVEAIVIPADTKTALMMHIAENLARGESEPISVARVLKKALDEGATIEEIAQATNHTPQWVKFMIALLDLPEEYQRALQEGQLKVGHVREAMRLPNPYEIDSALQTALRLGWDVKTMKIYVENRLEELRMHEETVKKTGVEAPPPKPEPERLVKYGQCLICGRMVPRDKLYLPATCEDCYQLAKYVTSQVGTGEDATKEIYEALKTYYDYLTYKERFMRQREMAEIGYPGPQPAPTPPNPQQNQEKPAEEAEKQAAES